MIRVSPSGFPTPYPKSLHSVPNQQSSFSSPHPLPQPLNQKSLVFTWKMQGDFYLHRKEIDLAIESYTKALQTAESPNDSLLIADSLKDLGSAFLEKEQWTFAAKIFNAALALYPKQNYNISPILSCMAEVERRYLEKECCIKATIFPKTYLVGRVKLKELRLSSRKKIEGGQHSQTILIEFTQSIGAFLTDLLKSGYSFLGKPPCDFTLLGLGSLARQEMSPYSDLEFAILVKENSPTNLIYFRKLVKWLEIQVINLGETSIKILDRGHVSPVIQGFSFDDGGNTPLGKKDYVELIKTPQELAQFQSERFYEEDLILSNALRGANIIVGSESLYQKYIQAMQAILVSKSLKSPFPLYLERAFHILQGHLREFEPQIDHKKEEIPLYNVKVELYRLPSFLIAGLADCCGIAEQNTWKRLDALFKRKILSPDGSGRLREALNATMNLRMRCHLYYGRECDYVYHPSMQIKGEGQLQNIFVLTDKDIDRIVQIYRIIFPLHRIFKQFCQTRDFASLSKETFYDNSLPAQAEAYQKLHKYEDAKRCYYKAVALNSQDFEAVRSLGMLLCQLGEYNEAKKYADKALELSMQQKNEEFIGRALNLQSIISHDLGNSKDAVLQDTKALEIVRKLHGNEHPSVAVGLNNLGSAWKDLGEAKKAIEYYEEALKIDKKIYGNEHPSVARSLNNLGTTWQDLGDAKRAIEYFEEALKIGKKIYDKEHPQIAIYLSNLGIAWKDLRDEKKAIEYYVEALKILKKLYGEEHPHIGTCVNNLGDAWKALGDAKKAIEYFEEALKIGKKIYGNEHPSVARSLNNLGSAWNDLGEAKKAIEYYEEALKIDKKIYGDEHPDVATRLNNLGTAWKYLGDAQRAIEYFEKALRIFKKVYGNEHPSVACSLNNLGTAWKDLGEAKQGIEYFEEALKIDKKIYGNEHPNVAIRLGYLGLSCLSLGDAKKALKYFEEALRVGKKIYGNEFPEIAKYFNSIGLAWKALGDAKKAIEYYEEALRIDKKICGDEHPDIGIHLNCLGAAWKELGDTKKAIEYHKEALKIFRKAFGNEHSQVAESLNRLGEAWQDLEEENDAVQFYEEGLRIYKKIYHGEHSGVARSLDNLASVWNKLNNGKKALECAEEALRINKKLYSDRHPAVAKNLNTIGCVWKTLGESKTSIGFFEEALKTFKEIYDDAHPLVALILANLGSAWKVLGEKEKATQYFLEALGIYRNKYDDKHPHIKTILRELS